jgi:CPA1 family monovalent cation:H+ antiporter
LRCISRITRSLLITPIEDIAVKRSRYFPWSKIQLIIMSGTTIILVEDIIVGLLLTASVAAVIARRLRIPYTVGLVVMGLVIGLFVPGELEISPQIILALLVPPLIFEASFHIRFDDLRRDFWLITLLAVPGVILTTLLVGWMVSRGTGMALPIALVFGALVSATDPVSVIALFRRLGAPRRLQVLLEGESLLNDGTAIVMYGVMLTIALQGTFFPVQSIAQFVTISGGGIIVGIVLGLLASQAIGRINDALVETTLTTVLAYAAYLVAEAFHVSGVLAVVVAGLVNGNTGPRGMSATTRVVVFNFWEYAAFIANSFVFLLIGLVVDFRLLVQNWEAIGWAILAALVARIFSIYGFSSFGREISSKWRHVLFWGGLRGAITLALALSLPEDGPLAAERGRLQAMAFGLVLFTLLVQGFSMAWLTKRLKIVQRTQAQEEYERRHARFVAGRAAYDYIEARNRTGLMSEHTWQRLAPVMKAQNDRLVDAMKDVMTSDPSVEAEELDTARREALRAQRAALIGLVRDGVISEEVFSELVAEVDEAILSDSVLWPALTRNGSVPRLPVRRLMTAIIQESDFEAVNRALHQQGFVVAHLPSTGGFLSRGNVTVLVGLPEGGEEAVISIFRENCCQRVEYIAAPIPEMSGVMPEPIPVTVGGATIFTFEVEAWEEF